MIGKCFGLLLTIFVAAGWACSPLPGPPPEIDEKIYYADAIVKGKVVKVTRPDPKFNYQSAYAVTMELDCVYKASNADFPRTMEIYGAGHVPGLCHGTNLVEGGEYYLFLRKENDIYTPGEAEINATDPLADEFQSICDLTSSAPNGVTYTDQKLKEMCPVYSGPIPGDCYKFQPQPTEPEVTTIAEITTKSEEPKSGASGKQTNEGNTGDAGGSASNVVASTLAVVLPLLLETIL